MNFKVVVLERDFCAKVGGYLDHERLHSLVGKRRRREENIVLDGQQPEADPIISASLWRPI